jgi:hypothetical protein
MGLDVKFSAHNPNAKPTFNGLASEMYKRFAGAAKNLKPLVKSDADKDLLVAQMHELRTWVREAFNAIKEMGDQDG